MHLFDPARPRNPLSNLPLLLTPEGKKTNLIVPNLSISNLDTPENHVTFFCFVPSNDCYNFKSKTISLALIPFFLEEYYSDPEKFLTKHFSLDLASINQLSEKIDFSQLEI